MSPNLYPLEISYSTLSTAIMQFNRFPLWALSRGLFPESSIHWAFPHFNSDNYCRHSLLKLSDYTPQHKESHPLRKEATLQETWPFAIYFPGLSSSLHSHTHCWGCASQVHFVCRPLRPCDGLQKICLTLNLNSKNLLDCPCGVPYNGTLIPRLLLPAKSSSDGRAGLFLCVGCLFISPGVVELLGKLSTNAGAWSPC